MSRARRAPSILFVIGLLAACSDSEPSQGSAGATDPPTVASADPSDVTDPTSPNVGLPLATWQVQPGVGQVAVLGAEPGAELVLRPVEGEPLATGVVDEQGALLFRGVPPTASVRVEGVDSASAFVTVLGANDVPTAEFYADQPLLPAGGFGYITTRDGTTLSANVVLPGPVEAGPYPTVVEYSGYAPSNPGAADFAQIYTTLGFAYVGVNMRGTGCSGGSYRFFEEAQSIDGYDVIEAIAAQSWVMDNEVGMVGISYPGISQLFVAATQPPSLNSITPLSVIADSFRSTLYPGGILNTGFAVEWTAQRMAESQPYGQGWEQGQVDGGDAVCEANQTMRLQNPDLVAEIDDNPFYAEPLGASLSPITFVDQINVPVFLAGAWQDEQTGGQFADMLDEFTGTDQLYVTLTNGLHTEALSPPVFGRYAEFLQLYVGKKTPDLAAANAILPVLGNSVWGVSTFRPFENRFTGLPYEEALGAFEAEPKVRVLVDQGAAEGFAPGTPEPAAVLEFSEWPIPEVEATRWLLSGGGNLVAEGQPTTGEQSNYNPDPDALPATFYDENGPGIWAADVQWDWQPIPGDTGTGFITAPLAEDLYVAGSGSADLWVALTDGDTDIEVTITEVRADGTEIYVQSGWQRASQRTIDEDRSSELLPVHTNLEADAGPIDPEAVELVRIEIFPFAHAFRAGSRLRLTIDAPGNNRAEWVFRTQNMEGSSVAIKHTAEYPSSIALSVIPASALSAPLPPPPPACGALRGQPCRDYVPAANGG